jgi:hypothetical protein
MNNGTSLTRYGVLLVAMQQRQQGNRALPSSVAMEAMIFTGGEIGDICPWQTKKIGQYTVQKEWSTKPGRS